jgi:hypothetical protein
MLVVKLRKVEFVIDDGRVAGVNRCIRTAVRESTLVISTEIVEGSLLGVAQVLLKFPLASAY